MFRIDDKRVIDATRAGSIAHLINHSCEVCIICSSCLIAFLLDMKICMKRSMPYMIYRKAL
jgi:hypothetical protein